MPLSEFYSMGKGKIEFPDQKTTYSSDISFLPDNELVELVWENGQIMMQGQSNKGRKSPVSSTFQFHTPRFRDKAIGNATTSKMGKFEAIESIFNDIAISVPSDEMGLSQDDDMVPWFNYPVDDTLQPGYCSELLPELSGVTVNEPSTQNSFALIDKTVSDSHNVGVNHGLNLEHGHSSKLSSSRTGQLYPWSLHHGQTSSPSLGSGVSDLISSNTTNSHHDVCGYSDQGQASAGVFPRTKMQKQDCGLPSCNSSLLNFSHFSRPAATAKANLQNIVAVAGSSSPDVDRMGDKDKGSAASSSNPTKSTLIDSNSGLQKEMGFHNQPNLVSAKVDLKSLATKPLEELRPAEQSDAVCREDAVKNDKSPNQELGGSATKGVTDGKKPVEPVVASSSVGSGNSAERASNDLTNNSKRKYRDIEEPGYQSDDVEEESVGVRKAASARGGTGSKRSRAAEVHNLSERRRRDRINEKMRALQELIPNCNKVDKASMLDEAIEYLKALQLQVQIMSMGAGLCMPQMMFPTGMQHIHATHLPHFSPMGIGMGMGMGFGMGMLDMNGGSCGRPMIPMPHMQVAHFPSPPICGPTSFQGIGGSNLQVFGHPGQGHPMPVFGAPLSSLSGRPPTNSAMGLNALKIGVHAELLNAAPELNSKNLSNNTNSPMMHNADTKCSSNQRSSQFQATNEGFDQSALVQKNDQVQDVGGSATIKLTNPNDAPPSRAAGCD